MIENILQGSKAEFKQRLTEAAAHIVSSTINEMRDLPDNSGFGLTRAEIEQMLNTWERHDLPPESYSIPEPHSVEGILRARLHPEPPAPEVPALHGPEEVDTARQPTRPAGLMPYDLALPPVNLKQAILQAYFDESVSEEQLEELSKQTHTSYISKASKSAVGLGKVIGHFTTDVSSDPEPLNTARRQVRNRMKGIDHAVSKLSEDLAIEEFTLDEIVEFMLSEEYGQLDELSKKTLGNYIQKASVSAANNAHAAGKADEKGNVKEMKHYHGEARGRIKGIAKATTKLVKESVEAFMQTEEYNQLDELSKALLDRYIHKTDPDYKTSAEVAKRAPGRALALKKKWGNEQYGLPEPKVKGTD